MTRQLFRRGAPRREHPVLVNRQRGVKMARKRLTQVFPFLIPLRVWQRKRCFYLKMRMDGRKYARERGDLLPYIGFEARSRMLNPETGCPYA